MGGSLAHADPAAQLPLVAVTLGAEIDVVGPRGLRTLAATEFFVSAMATTLEADEIVVETRFPKRVAREGSAFELFSRRHGDFAIVAVAVTVALDGADRVGRLRLGVGGVDAVPQALDDARGRSAGAPRMPIGAGTWPRLRAGARSRGGQHVPAEFRRELTAALRRRALDAPLPVPRGIAPWKKSRSSSTSTAPARHPGRAAQAPVRRAARRLPPDGYACGLRTRRMRRMHGAGRRAARPRLPHLRGADGRPPITTIEAVAENGRFSPLQQALHEEHGLQCGFCTPGIVMTFEAFLREHPDPSEEAIRETLSGNLCRCTGYQNIVAAIRRPRCGCGRRGLCRPVSSSISASRSRGRKMTVC